MLEFTEPLREVCDLAVKEANRLRHNSVSPGHYLLAMIRHGSDVATTAMRILMVDLDVLKSMLEEMLGVGEGPSVGDVPNNAMSEHMLADATKIAKSMEHDMVSTGHLLLAIMDEDDSPAALVLADAGLDYEEVARQVILLLEGSHTVGIEPEETQPPELEEEMPARRPIEVPETLVGAAAGTDLELEWVDLNKVEFTRAVVAALPLEIVRDFRVVPIAVEGDRITIAMADPLLMPKVLQMCERLELVADLKVCSFEDYERALARHFGGI